MIASIDHLHPNLYNVWMTLMTENLVWTTGYTVVAIPVAAGVLTSWASTCLMAFGAVAMSASYDHRRRQRAALPSAPSRAGRGAPGRERADRDDRSAACRVNRPGMGAQLRGCMRSDGGLDGASVATACERCPPLRGGLSPLCR